MSREKGASQWTWPGIAMVVALVWAGCEGTIEPEPVHLSGVVREEASHMPIDSAWVAAGDTAQPNLTILTDTAGAFQLVMFPQRSLTLYAGKSGYQTTHRTYTHVDDDIDSITFDLERASSN